MQSLIHEISNLKSEIESLKENRFTEEFRHQSNTLIQEDLLAIKGEIRKLNLRLMGDEVRRSSLTINSLDKACHSHVKNKPLRGTENDLRISDEFDSNSTVMSPSAPPASQENWHMMERLLNDAGGPPSAPTFADALIGSDGTLGGNCGGALTGSSELPGRELHRGSSAGAVGNQRVVAVGCPEPNGD